MAPEVLIDVTMHCVFDLLAIVWGNVFVNQLFVCLSVRSFVAAAPYGDDEAGAASDDSDNDSVGDHMYGLLFAVLLLRFVFFLICVVADVV